MGNWKNTVQVFVGAVDRYRRVEFADQKEMAEFLDKVAARHSFVCTNK